MAENTTTKHAEHMEHMEHTVHVEHEHAEHIDHAETKRKLEQKVKTFQLISAVLTLIVIVLAAYSFNPHGVVSTTVTTTISGSGNGLVAGQTLAGINNPLSSSELAALNNAPNSYFQYAGEGILNLSISGEAVNNGSYSGVVYMGKQKRYAPLVVNGKPSVIYIGAISCIYCAENRWAMALALTRFGSFSSLYKGYSSLGDGDVPTLFWAPQNINSSGVDFANYYSSSSINFFTGEYDSPITAGFQGPSSGYDTFIQAANTPSDKLAMEFMANLSQFRGTPASLFGTTLNGGADAVVFGEPNSTNSQNSKLPPLTYMTHSGIIGQLGSMSSLFAEKEYAAADVYVAEICISLNNTASACALPAIKSMESIMTS